MSVASPSLTPPVTRRAVPLPARLAWGAFGLAALAGGVLTLGPVALAAWFAPDLAMLAGLSRDMPRDGRMPPRAVPFYNAAHALAGPLALTGLGLLAGPVVLGLGLTWLSHVAIDRAMGYGLRTPEGFQRA